jgi:hypothetical protein
VGGGAGKAWVRRSLRLREAALGLGMNLSWSFPVWDYTVPGKAKGASHGACACFTLYNYYTTSERVNGTWFRFYLMNRSKELREQLQV